MNRELREKILEKLEGVNGLNPKSGLAYVLKRFSELVKKGIGMSRREITSGTGELSPFIHAWSTFKRYLGICKEFVGYCKGRGVNKLHKIQYSTVADFLITKTKTGRGLSQNAMEVNLCALMKFFHDSNRGDLRDSLSNDYSHFKHLAQIGTSIYSFDRPDEVIAKLFEKAELSGTIAKVERLTGARIHEVRPLEIEGTNVVIRKGKGGRPRTVDFSHRPEDLEELKKLLPRLKDLSAGVD
jgi:site-specific recombinase XerD